MSSSVALDCSVLFFFTTKQGDFRFSSCKHIYWHDIRGIGKKPSTNEIKTNKHNQIITVFSTFFLKHAYVL